jgi:peptidyl-prolyl cis-trans isomerase A (cyclophilin A)
VSSRLPAHFTLVLALCAGIAAHAQQTTAPQSPKSVVTGVVTVDGTPRAGVTVRVTRSGSIDAVATATTGADGAYRINGLARGVYRFDFDAGDDVAATARSGIVVFEDVPTELSVALRSTKGMVPEPPPSEACNSVKAGEVCVRLESSLGFIFLAIDTAHAPVTATNFLKYVSGGFYTAGRFHRATRPDNYKPVLPNRPMMEIIQGGINPEMRAKGFPPIPLERTSVTGLKHVRGTVSMARGDAADTATSDFFILLDDQPSLDFGGKRFDDGQGAAAFGRVITGMSVVRTIQQHPVTDQALTPPVPIIAAVRIGGV